MAAKTEGAARKQLFEIIIAAITTTPQFELTSFGTFSGFFSFWPVITAPQRDGRSGAEKRGKYDYVDY